MERKPAREKHDLHRHRGHGAPGNHSIKGEQIAREDIAVGSTAFGKKPTACPRHMRRIGRIADHFQREIGLHACADIGGAFVEQSPTAIGGLDAAEIARDLRLERGIDGLPAKVAQQHIFRWDRRVRLKLEDEMSIRTLQRA
jgi:hypothetical protein